MLEGAVVIQKEGFKATGAHVKHDPGECFKPDYIIIMLIANIY